MQWYYSKNGTQLGPVAEGELRAKLASGEISPADLVWKEGMSDWLPSARVPELASIATIPSATSQVPPVSGNVANSPYSPPAATPPSYHSPAAMGPNIPNYLWQSIVVTIFCCWPFGIPAIVYAAKVDGLKARGDIAGAMSASKSAKMWCNVSVGLWVLLIILVGLMGGLGALLERQ
ncbi:MAG: CD225/dispanin family protein [Verrucomicrobiota bacterium]